MKRESRVELRRAVPEVSGKVHSVIAADDKSKQLQLPLSHLAVYAASNRPKVLMNTGLEG
ncbi:MAG: hypothetical protein M3463_05570 [Verrucomicrobiota bacterium]|nr:hypothetical protein [Verrucomicrobiota bacterium]